MEPRGPAGDNVTAKDGVNRLEKPSTEELLEILEKKDRGTPLTEKVIALRQKLAKKASLEPTFKFYSLYNLICREDVLWAAWIQVCRNQGAPGVDNISIGGVLQQEGGPLKLIHEIQEELKSKTYKPKPIRRVYIPKSDGKLRGLGIPTVKDRIVQMAAVLILEPIFEADFLNCSYGFRPGKSAHDAIDDIAKNIKEGRIEVYDADLKTYFDLIPHDKLMACVNRRITDSSVLKLIRMWLKAPIIESEGKGKGSKVIKPLRGIPQGGCISPLLSNLFLHWFDMSFHWKDGPRQFANARLIRYADDFVVMARYISSRITEYIRRKIENWMGLEINLEKTKTVNLNHEKTSLDFLGFNLRKVKSKFSKGTYLKIQPRKKAFEKAKEKIRDLTDSRWNCLPIKDVIGQINRFLVGWKGYFDKGNPHDVFDKIDGYTRMKMVRHLKKRSQRGYKKAKGVTWYRLLENLGLMRMTDRKGEASRKAVWGKSACTV